MKLKLLVRVPLVVGSLLGFVGVSVNAVEGAGYEIKDSWLIAKYDANGDNTISVDEVASKRDKIFSYMDADDDGTVSFAEYQSLDVRKREVLLEARYKKLDLDHDGRISAKEYRSYLGSFERLDFDGDGIITTEEINSGAEPSHETLAEESTHCLLWLCVRTSLD